jgi:hypothetical protein
MMNARNGCLIALMTLLSACAREDRPDAGFVEDTEDSAASIAPAISPPDESADPAQPPSYEVSIASAAADHNKAIERCAAQPEAVRTRCEQEANAAFAEVGATLEPLRGNQE